jgi:hypothetical protein
MVEEQTETKRRKKGETPWDRVGWGEKVLLCSKFPTFHPPVFLI